MQASAGCTHEAWAWRVEHGRLLADCAGGIVADAATSSPPGSQAWQHHTQNLGRRGAARGKSSMRTVLRDDGMTSIVTMRLNSCNTFRRGVVESRGIADRMLFQQQFACPEVAEGQLFAYLMWAF